MDLRKDQERQTGARATSRRVARGDGERGASIDALIARDPLLRLHCAISHPSEWQVYPWHPFHPEGTRSVSLSALAADGGLRARVFARHVAHRGDALAHFVAYFVRPLVKSVRIALERHHVALLRHHDETRVAFELSADFRATGRIVLRDFDARAPATPHETAETLHTLRDCLAKLVAAFRHAQSPSSPADNVEGAVFAAVAEELRFVPPEIARALPNELVHAPPIEQEAILREVLRRVETRARERVADPTRLPPAVVIDVDLCGFMPRDRTLAAVRQVGGPQPGAPHGIRALLEPEGLTVLPVHHELGWRHFVAAHGLDEAYPGVDWAELRVRFERAYHRPWENLRTDRVTPGLARFVRDILHAGGEVVFNSGRRHRVRCHTEYVLTRAGLPSTPLLTMPDDRVRPVADLKVENMRCLPPLDVVAIFDDLADNRTALAHTYPTAMGVAVRIPGFAGESTGTSVPTVATFEMRPRVQVPARGEVPAPLAAQSIGKLAIAELYAPPWAAEHAVCLTTEQSRGIIGHLVARAEEDSERAARAALSRARASVPGADQTERDVFALHQVLTRGQFFKGRRSHYPLETAALDVGPYVAARAPLRVVMLGFPIKHGDSGLKAFGPLPDFAEMAALVRLRELVGTLRRVYEPGVELTVLMDSGHFRPHPADVTNRYHQKLRDYRDVVGMDGMTFRDIDEFAEQRLAPGTRARREERIREEEERLREVLDGLAIERDPLGALRAAAARHSGTSTLSFDELFRSLIHSIPMPPPPSGMQLVAWSKALYANVYHPDDPDASDDVRAGRGTLLLTAWRHTVRYMAAVRVNRTMPEYGEPVTPRVRLAAVPRLHCCGYSSLGGSTLLPWHGTGAIDPRGYVSTEFAIALLDQGFVPVYSPLLGNEQPWMMVPATATRVPRRGARAELDPAFVRTIRMRRT
ncbi:isocyanide synthase family protein [Pendulispora rubella]|uniref:Isocyanide synthase family protein n=1 Tax=Pendulispora rubella TaxID=2741070 RepID=A0ABZ2LHN9_9BACT